jgi:cytochrome c peroxidase
VIDKAYGPEGITKESVAKAIASFERIVISKDSAFDQWLAGDQNVVWCETRDERRIRELRTRLRPKGDPASPL